MAPAPAPAASVDDDEVSTVLRRFRPRPGFVSTDTLGGEHARSRPMGGRRSRRRGGGSSSSSSRPDRGYSGVGYVGPTNNEGGKIRLAYLHVRDPAGRRGGRPISVFLTFEMSVDTGRVTCADVCSPDDSLSASIGSRLDRTCEVLSVSGEDDTNKQSLFSIASRLLRLLDELEFPANINNGDGSTSTGESFDEVVERVAESKSRPPTEVHDLIDLQALLLRCAAAGRNRSRVCSPVPAEFAAHAGSKGQADALSHLVFDASNGLYAHGFRGGQCNDRSDASDAMTLLSFLLSLPWTGGSRLAQDKFPCDSNGNATTDGNGNGKRAADRKDSSASSNIVVGRLSLDIGTALGDPSPTFSRLASEHGTVRAYHGTKVESAWSILNHGLQNLSYNSALSQNGAMMGDGVYLSTSCKVAESFARSAAERPPRTLAGAFLHGSFVHLLAYAGVDVGALDPLEGYDVVILPVFEATIVGPPGDGRGDDGGGTRREGKYYVCSDGELVRLTGLHLTIELRRKSGVWTWFFPGRTTLAAIVLLLAVIWAGVS